MNLSALKFRDFRIYLGGNLFAVNALWMQRVTIGWIAWELTSSATFVGFIAFVNFAPAMVTGPLFGVLVDRMRITQVAKLTQILLLIISLGFYLFFTFGILDEILLSFLSFLSGLVTSARSCLGCLCGLNCRNQFQFGKIDGTRHWWMANSGLGYKHSPPCSNRFLFAVHLRNKSATPSRAIIFHN